jgi:hypothetical protein
MEYRAVYYSGARWKSISDWTEDRDEAQAAAKDFITGLREDGYPYWDFPEVEIQTKEAAIR